MVHIVNNIALFSAVPHLLQRDILLQAKIASQHPAYIQEENKAFMA